jgi:hypothetical protein
MLPSWRADVTAWACVVGGARVFRSSFSWHVSDSQAKQGKRKKKHANNKAKMNEKKKAGRKLTSQMNEPK